MAGQSAGVAPRPAAAAAHRRSRAAPLAGTPGPTRRGWLGPPATPRRACRRHTGNDPMSYDIEHALSAAREAAAAAAEIIRHYWNRGVAVEWKADATPVTVADRSEERRVGKEGRAGWRARAE